VVSDTTTKSAPGGRGSTRVQGDPLVPRLLLGRRLRDLREARGMTRADAAGAAHVSISKLTCIEHGRTGVRQRDLAGLLAAYGIGDEAERSTLAALAEQTNARPWWHPRRDAVPHGMGGYLSAETAARLVRRFEDRYVPELLRTDAYARAVLRDEAPEAVEARLDLLSRRRRLLRRRPRPLNLWAVLDEAVLRNRVGDAVTMRGQLRHLIEMCWRPNVTVQILPSALRHDADGPLTLVRFPQASLPDLVYLDPPRGPSYPSRQGDIEQYWHVFNTLVTRAAPPERTPQIIESVLAGA